MTKRRGKTAAAAVVVIMAFGLALFWVCHTAAQAASGSAASADIMVTAAPGATPVAEPGPTTPVPAWAQQSYNAYLSMKAQAHGGLRYTAEASAQIPNWSGVWNHIDGSVWDHSVNPIAQQSNPPQMRAIFEHCPSFPCAGWMTAALKPAYALRYREKLIAAAHDVYWDDLNDCLPAGFPRDMLFGGGYARYFVVTASMTLMYFPEDEGNRVIFTDGRGHRPPDEAYPLWVGDSIGFWDEGTLVVHTLYLRNMELNRNLPADSEEASVLERIRMTDPNTIQDEMTLYDPKMLYRPWSGVQTFKRGTDRHVIVDLYSCDENNQTYAGPNGSTEALMPGQTITIKRTYPSSPEQIQNLIGNRVIEYGARLLHEKAEVDTQ